MRPYLTGEMAWDYEGVSGVNERKFYEPSLGQSRAVELRTLQLQTLTGLNKILANAYYLGAALKAYQRRQSNHEKVGDLSSEEMQLASIWQSFERDLLEKFTQYNLLAPNIPWESPLLGFRQARARGIRYENNMLNEQSGFIGLSELLNTAEKNPRGSGGQFVAEMRSLMTQTRIDCANIIHPIERKVEHQTQTESPIFYTNEQLPQAAD